MDKCRELETKSQIESIPIVGKGHETHPRLDVAKILSGLQTGNSSIGIHTMRDTVNCESHDWFEVFKG